MAKTSAGIGVGGLIAFALGLGASCSDITGSVAAPRAGEAIQDCEVCPEMVVVPASSFTMGSPGTENGRYDDEEPQYRVTINYEFAVGIYEVTFDEWEACVRGSGCRGHLPSGSGSGLGRHPVTNVSWEDAQAYVEWLSRTTGEQYRLLTEAEWEYVARAGTRTARHWGESESEQCRYANGRDAAVPCSDGYANTAPAGSFDPNSFGLYDVLGNVWEWTEDCWKDNYSDAPNDGSARQTGNCSVRLARGGSWLTAPRALRSAARGRTDAGNRHTDLGFRVARAIMS